MNNSTFEDYYKDLWGERWPRLRKALLAPEKKVLRAPFMREDEPQEPALKSLDAYKNVFSLEDAELGPYTELRYSGEEPLLKYYAMDLASIIAADLLPVKPGDRVLDMCSAPGGKGLILSEKVGEDGEVILNEPSEGRRQRLKKVVQQFIPKQRRSNIFVKGKDGVKYGLFEKDSFDHILVDAPCSGERHLIVNETEVENWKESRTKGLSKKQYSLLCSALLAVKSGGFILYSTCSISSLENDGVISKLLKKKSESVKLISMEENPLWECTEFGGIILPDWSSNGPIYFSLLQKR